MNPKTRGIAVLALVIVLAAGCSSGGGGDPEQPPPPQGTAISGTVSAPGGTVAFNAPGPLQRMLAEIFGRPAFAALTGVSPVAGVSVELIQIDDSGAQVGSAMASGTTNASGNYTVNAPASFAPSANFVVRARGTTNLDAMATGTTVNVDPASDAARSTILSALAATGRSLSNISVADVLEVQDTVEELAHEIPDGSKASAAAYRNALSAEANRNEEARFIARNITAAGGVTGRVTDASGQPVPGITIVVGDFGDWVVRNVGRTDAQGRYTVRVAPGDYIVGAMNRTAIHTGASEWWTSSGGAVKYLAAENVTVGATLVTLDFALAAGGRISGTVSAESTGVALPGITIKVREFLTNQSVAAVKTKPDGTYHINVAPGAYLLEAENTTFRPFASETYNPAINGGLSFGEAARLNVTVGSTSTADFSLQPGRMLSGLISDPVTGPVTGVRIRIDDAASEVEHAVVRRSDNVGEYRVWLRPGNYTVRARGQTATADLSTANQTLNFAAAVGELRMTLRHAGNPFSQANVLLRDGNAPTAANVSKENSNGDGTLSLYTLTSADNYRLEIRVANGAMVGSAIYNGKTRLLSADPVSVTVGSTNNIGVLDLPAGGVLSGTVTVGGTPQGNVRIQVRSGGTTAGDRFTNTSTQADGTYSISLPAGTYNRVCAFTGSSATVCPGGAVTTSGTGYHFVNGLFITAGVTTTQNFAIP